MEQNFFTHKAGYMQFIFSDRKAYPIWGGICLFIMFLALLSSLIRYRHITVAPLYVLLIIILMYISFYSCSYIFYLKYFSIRSILDNQSVVYSHGSCLMDIDQKSYFIKPFLGNSDIRMKSRKKVTGQYIRTADLLILFYTITELGICKYEPLVCIKLDNKDSGYHFAGNVIDRENVTLTDHQVIIRHPANRVNKIILSDFTL